MQLAMNTKGKLSDGPPAANIEQQALSDAGFTASGKTRFNTTVQEYNNALFQKAVSYGDIDKDPTLRREVTHDHVRSAAHSMAQSFGRPERPRWAMPAQVFEYIFTASSGAGAGHLDNALGIAVFVTGAACAVLLLVLRISRSQPE